MEHGPRKIEKIALEDAQKKTTIRMLVTTISKMVITKLMIVQTKSMDACNNKRGS